MLWSRNWRKVMFTCKLLYHFLNFSFCLRVQIRFLQVLRLDGHLLIVLYQKHTPSRLPFYLSQNHSLFFVQMLCFSKSVQSHPIALTTPRKYLRSVFFQFNFWCHDVKSFPLLFLQSNELMFNFLRTKSNFTSESCNTI